jgi:thiol-disulfide isomerase/thioredoxin
MISLQSTYLLWCALKVALIAGGGQAIDNDHSHLNHILSIFKVLESQGVASEDIQIFWADGTDESVDRRVPDPHPSSLAWIAQDTPWAFWFEHTPRLADTRWESKHVLPAKRHALQTWLQSIKSKMNTQDQLWMIVTDHGRPDTQGGWKTAIELWGETWSVDQVYQDLQILPKTIQISLWMSQCFSGGFAHLATMDSRVCGAFSSEANRPAYGCFSLPNQNEKIGHFMHMVSGLKQSGRLDVASDWSSEFDMTPDTPHLSSDALIKRLTQARAEALGVPISHLVDIALPNMSILNTQEQDIIKSITRIAIRFNLGLVHSYSQVVTLSKEIQTMTYTLDAWLSKWKQLLHSARLRLLSQSPIPAEAPLKKSKKSRGKRRLKKWLKSAQRKGLEGKRGLLSELRQKVIRGEYLMDQLYTLEAVTIRLRHLYMRLASKNLLNPHDYQIWHRIRTCEKRSLWKTNKKKKKRSHTKQDIPSISPVFPSLSDLESEVATLRPGHIAIQYKEKPRSKKIQVSEVGYGSPAWTIDLKKDDFIESVDGRRLAYSGQLEEQVALYPLGEMLSIKRRRKRSSLLLHLPVVGVPLSPAPPRRGEQIPPLNLSPILEQDHLDDWLTGGRPVLLFFWATWCKECVRIAPMVHAWALKHDLQVIAVTAEDPSLVRAVLKSSAMPFPVLHDLGHEASRLFRVDLSQAMSAVMVYLDVERRLIEQGIGWGQKGPQRIEALFEDK